MAFRSQSVIWGLTLAAAFYSGSLQAQAQDYRPGYVLALRCFVVAHSAKDDVGSRKAFDAAMNLGRLQGLSNRQLNADLDQWQAAELVKIARSPAYLQQMVGACRRLGFMS